MSVREAHGQLYEILSSCETSGNWTYELQALHGDVRTMPLGVLGRFLETAQEQ